MNWRENPALRTKPSTLECVAIFLDRRSRPAINFIECGSSGFGDRMRGIAYALFLARKHRTSKIYYSQTVDLPEKIHESSFPFNMTDLISIRGMEFLPFSVPIELRTATYIHYSEAGNPLKRYGFSDMWRIEPRQPTVVSRLTDISSMGPYLALHIRKTDAEYRSDKFNTSDKATVERLKEESKRTGTKRVYVAADNAESFAIWSERLVNDGFDIIENRAAFDAAMNRHTDSEDTMVDFFALAHSEALVRCVPSEFSRFAAWVGRKRLRYNDLA